MKTGRELLVDPLPDDVKAKVVWREKFWLTDEAISTYVRSRRTGQPGDAQSDHVHRQWRPRDRLPLRGADHQGFHVARHRLGRLALRSRQRRTNSRASLPRRSRLRRIPPPPGRRRRRLASSCSSASARRWPSCKKPRRQPFDPVPGRIIRLAQVGSWDMLQAMSFSRSFDAATARPAPAVERLAALLEPKSEAALAAMVAQSRRLTRRNFGRTMRLFAPLYLSNECINNCSYCGFSRDNPILRVTLTVAAGGGGGAASGRAGISQHPARGGRASAFCQRRLP